MKPFCILETSVDTEIFNKHQSSGPSSFITLGGFLVKQSHDIKSVNRICNQIAKNKMLLVYELNRFSFFNQLYTFEPVCEDLK